MTKSELAERVAALPPEKRAALFAKLQAEEGRKGRDAAEPIPRRPKGDAMVELSFAQQRLWFLNQFDSRSAEYNIPLAYWLHGDLDAALLRQAFLALIERHESLRTTYTLVGEEARQVIHEKLEVPMSQVDLRPRVEEVREKDARFEMAVDAKKPFDIEKGPLIRGTLFQFEEEKHLIYFNVHHITFDGWSNGVLMRELMALYNALHEGRTPDLPEMPIQYADFAVWQRGYLKDDVLERQVGYWKKQIDGTPPLEMATDRPHPAVRTWKGTTYAVELGEELSEGLESLSRSAGCTLFVTVLAAFRSLLHRYTHQDDFAIGTLIANRTRPELEGLIGFFANTLVLRTPLMRNVTFRELLALEKKNALDAYDHQDVPFEKVVEELSPARDMSRTPYFQVMMILQNAPSARENEAKEKGQDGGGVRLAPLGVDSQTSKFELTLYLTQGKNVRGFFEYNTDLFDRETIARLERHFRLLLKGIIADPDRPVNAYPLMGDEERHESVVTWNETAGDMPAELGIHQLFERQVDQRPDADAAVCGSESLTYRELDERSNRLANHLLELGVQPEQFVGVCTDRSTHLLVALLAVLKAGCAYLPLDPDYPDDRLAYMIDDTAAPVVLTLAELRERLPSKSYKVVEMDRLDLSGQSTTRPSSGGSGSRLAYVIHTSGSTGKPKGVTISHAAVVNFLTSMAETPGLTDKDTLLAVTTISFDIAGLELYLPLIQGARMVVASRETAAAGEQLMALLKTCGATVMQATPATWQLLYGAGWEGDPNLKVLCGGEALPSELAERLLRHCRQVWNVYGPTEATIWSTLRRIDADDLGGGAVSIGRPLLNTQIYLVDRSFSPVPVGVPGELLIGGEGLARGYLNRPAMAAERFQPNPFATDTESGSRLYRTGDSVRYLPDGNLHFLGRLDTQVKLHGYRIELGEIESVLDHHEAVTQGIVTIREDTPGVPRLVAYVVGKDLPKPGDLKDFLKKKLPEYMVPAIFMPMEKLPLTPNGKVDRRALPKPDPTLLRTTEYVPPKGEKEEAFAAIFSEVLDVAEVGRDDDFFDLGGDSLLVIRVVTQAKKKDLVVTTKQLFQHRTVAELAKVEGSATILAEQGQVTGDVIMSPAQQHFLGFGHPLPHLHAIGADMVAKQGFYDVDALRGALTKLVEQHDTLRMRFHPDDQRKMISEPVGELPLTVVDLRDLPESEQEQAMGEKGLAFARSFRFDDGKPLFKAELYRTDAKDLLFMIGHFMVADIGSWQIILDDLDTAYRQLSRGEELVLQAKTTSFQQWIDRLSERANGADIEPEKGYWLDDRREEIKPVPRDMPDGENVMRSSKSIWHEFNEEQSEALLRQVPRATGTQIDAVILTAALHAYQRWTDERSLLINLLGHGREAIYDDIDLTRTVGWVNTIYPAYLTLGAAPHPVAALKSVNKQLRDIPHGGIGYGLLHYLCDQPEVAKKLAAQPQADVFFNYFGDDHRSELTVLQKELDHTGWSLDLDTKRLCPIGIFGYVREKKLQVRWEYSVNVHHDETMEKAAGALRETLEHLIEHH